MQRLSRKGVLSACGGGEAPTIRLRRTCPPVEDDDIVQALEQFRGTCNRRDAGSSPARGASRGFKDK